MENGLDLPIVFPAPPKSYHKLAEREEYSRSRFCSFGRCDVGEYQRKTLVAPREGFRMGNHIAVREKIRTLIHSKTPQDRPPNLTMPYRREFTLPPVVAELVAARNRLREHYKTAGLKFTLDGNLVGDIGEAVAAELFGIELTEANGTGIDGHAADRRSVQVKATGTGRGPVFRCVDTRADHLLFFDIDFENLRGEVIFNGPERIALERMPEVWVGQRPVSKVQIRAADALVRLDDRLRRIDL